MADFVFNIAKGRAIELYNRVKSNDPINSALVLVVINANGDTDAVMKDRDDLAALLAGTANEVTNANYARKVLTDADLATLPAPDDVNDRFDIDLPDQIWANIAAGDPWTDIILCYDPDTTAGTDASIIPIGCYDFVMTPDGSSLEAVINAAGAYRAS